jgi:signal transduction histidine kinase
MVPEFLPNFIVGPLCALAVNAILTILCLIFSIIYSHYRPLRILCFFYLFIALVFLGWVIWGLQRSPESVLLGYRILYASLALLPATWFWFFLELFNERRRTLTWVMTGVGILFAVSALFGRGPLFFGLPLEPDPIVFNFWRPQSTLLKVLIQSFCLAACILYILLILSRPLRFKERKQVLIPVILGLLIWFLGGLNDALLASGVTFISNERLLWFASIWLTLFLTIAVALHFRSLEREVSQLQRAHIDTLEQSRKGLEELSIAKSKALDHLSHELKTPLSVIQANIRLLKRKISVQTSPIVREEVFDSLERNLNRISNIQREADQIIRFSQKLEVTSSVEKIDTRETLAMETISLYPFIEQILKKVKQNAAHRDLLIKLHGTNDLSLNMNSGILEDIMIGLLRNSIENTPDEGLVRVVSEQKGQWIQLKVQDFGIGITEENQRHLFDGLFHALDTKLYTSKEPYGFRAGGKGLDLLKMKVYSKCFGFDISVASQRCIHLPKEGDLCPGKISLCKYCKQPEDCLSSGGSTFCLSFESYPCF